jgi:FSR family fosmidomycin resistance protein-like MFS transporter
MRRLTLPLVLGLAHGAADGVAGLLLGGLPRALAVEQVALLVLLYNALAFGGQPIVGLLADRLARPRAAALAGLGLLGAALLLYAGQPRAAVVLAGLGSAAFHVGGGALALHATSGRAAGPGLFAAPGVIGLAAGGALAAAGYAPIWPALVLLVALASGIAGLGLPTLSYPAETIDDRGWTMAGVQSSLAHRPPSPTLHPPSPGGFETHDLVMLVLLAGIALRSLVWSSLQFVFAGRYDLLIAMAVAAAIGKIAGGLLADRVGWARWVTGALALAAPLLVLSGERILPLLLGVALLQSATPAALVAAGRLLPGRPATAAGLALGLAVAIGGVPAAGGAGAAIASAPVLATILLAAALALWWALRQIVRGIGDPVGRPPPSLVPLAQPRVKRP